MANSKDKDQILGGGNRAIKLGDTVRTLREIAEEIEKAPEDQYHRYGIICAFTMPCKNEKQEGHKHQQLSVIIGGEARLGPVLHEELTDRMLESLPDLMLARVLAKRLGMGKDTDVHILTLDDLKQFIKGKADAKDPD